MSEKLLGSIEAGGTKFVCAVGNFEYEVVETVQFPTTTPMETLQKAIDFFGNLMWPQLELALLVQSISMFIQQHLGMCYQHQRRVGQILILLEH